MYIPIPIPIPNWKSRGFPIPIPIPSQCGDFPSKRGRVRAIPTGTGLFAISSWYFDLDPWGVTCREDFDDQVSQQILRKSNLMIKRLMRKSNLMIKRLMNAYLPRHGMGPCLSRMWVWARPRPLSLIIVGLRGFASNALSL